MFGSQGATHGVALKATLCGFFSHAIFQGVTLLFLN